MPPQSKNIVHASIAPDREAQATLNALAGQFDVKPDQIEGAIRLAIHSGSGGDAQAKTLGILVRREKNRPDILDNGSPINVERVAQKLGLNNCSLMLLKYQGADQEVIPNTFVTIEALPKGKSELCVVEVWPYDGDNDSANTLFHYDERLIQHVNGVSSFKVSINRIPIREDGTFDSNSEDVVGCDHGGDWPTSIHLTGVLTPGASLDETERQKLHDFAHKK